MVYACTNPNAYDYHNHGGYGIRVYAPWIPFKQGFDAYADWVEANLGPQPHADAIIRRKNSQGHFYPSNLEWSDRQIMSNHRRTNLVIKVGRKKQSLADWCRELGIPSRTVWSRIERGSTMKEALGL
jgi:hypothetical protein